MGDFEHYDIQNLRLQPQTSNLQIPTKRESVQRVLYQEQMRYDRDPDVVEVNVVDPDIFDHF